MTRVESSRREWEEKFNLGRIDSPLGRIRTYKSTQISLTPYVPSGGIKNVTTLFLFLSSPPLSPLSHRPRPKERRRRGGSAAGDEGGRRSEDDRRRSEDGGNGDVSEKGGDSGRTVRTHLPLLLEPSWVVRFNDTIDSIRFDSIP
mmetsp:Transcript_27985/g.82289  ORF Transcript_27985/g.82289 Transcript_27985/m.82289 type:complete len:145 (+) Transcript_27985:1088-1522(+)